LLVIRSGSGRLPSILPAGQRRKGDGWTADRIAAHLNIREADLDACFGPDKRQRCGLVSIERPKHVRDKEREAAKSARKKARRTCRTKYQAQANADREEAARLGVSYEAARNRRRRAEKREQSARDQVRPPSHDSTDMGVTLGSRGAPCINSAGLFDYRGKRNLSGKLLDAIKVTAPGLS
jgi:hypothetical protein